MNKMLWILILITNSQSYLEPLSKVIVDYNI
jgi:hypothetical protein